MSVGVGFIGSVLALVLMSSIHSGGVLGNEGNLESGGQKKLLEKKGTSLDGDSSESKKADWCLSVAPGSRGWEGSMYIYLFFGGNETRNGTWCLIVRVVPVFRE
jgi:hypothetical protein